MRDYLMMKRIVSVVFILSVLFSSCKKESGYYFNVKIDGENFSADLRDPVRYGAWRRENSLYINATKDVVNPSLGTFKIRIYDSYYGAGRYVVGRGARGNHSASYIMGTLANGGTISSWEADVWEPVTSGVLVITSDENGVIEGTLEFEGREYRGNSIKRITNGNFRMNLLQK